MYPNDNPIPQNPGGQQPPQHPPLYPTQPYGAPPMPPQPEPQLPEPQQPNAADLYSPSPPGKKMWLVLGMVAVLVILAIGAYVLFVRGDRTSGIDKNTGAGVKLTQLASLSEVTLIPPSNLSRYRANNANAATAMEYTATDDACTLRMGVAGKDELPGDNADAIIQQHIKTLKDGGATVGKPGTGTALTLKDATDSKKAYSMPSTNITATQKDKRIATHYSVVVLKNGKRVYVERTCQSNDAGGATERLKAIDADAGTIAAVPR